MDDGVDKMNGYERWLDVSDGTSGCTILPMVWTTSASSWPANLLVWLRCACAFPRTGGVSFHLHLDWSTPGSLNRWEDYSEKSGSDTIIMGGGSGGFDPIIYAAGARIVAPTGKVSTIGDTAFCRNATEAWVYFQSWTSFRQADPRTAVLDDLKAVTATYPEIRAAHVADYQSYFNRTSLNLGTSTTKQKGMTTGDRVNATTQNTFDPELASLYFQFGRYLLIATSRAGTLPPNLQGIWNSDFDPMWGSKYTININLQMNYWPSLVTNLVGLNSPLYNLIDQMRINGTEVARAMYNASGSVTHHNTDLWADCAPQDNYFSSTYYSGGLAWLSTHIMQDYLYTGNTSFLEAHYDVPRDVMLFYLDFMTEEPIHGWKVTNPSISPENVYYLPNTTIEEAITMGPTIDISLIWELIGYTLEAMEALGMQEAGFKQELLTLRSQLPPIQISYFGGVQEWIYDYKEQDPGHRHFSPLFRLFPGSQITSANATSFDAAKTTLMRRLSHGDGDTGWSRAWAISLAARSFLNDEVHHSLVHLMKNLTYSISLLDTGPPAPFQIHGNFGGTAGIAEALIQSHELVGPHKSSTVNKGTQLKPAYWGYGIGSKTTLLRLLPALPTQWAENGGGSVNGVLARGGFEVDISWNSKAELTGANITSLLGHSVWVTIGSESIEDEAAKTDLAGSPIKIDGAGSGRFVLLATEKGKRIP